MNCLSCGKAAGYNRVVIDAHTGTELGGFCMNCEKDRFGEALSYMHADETDSCSLCERDGLYLLARYVPSAEERDDGVIHCSVSVESANSALRLCDEHYHELLADRRAAKPVVK